MGTLLGARLVKTKTSKVAVSGLTRMEVDYGQRTASSRIGDEFSVFES